MLLLLQSPFRSATKSTGIFRLFVPPFLLVSDLLSHVCSALASVRMIECMATRTHARTHSYTLDADTQKKNSASLLLFLLVSAQNTFWHFGHVLLSLFYSSSTTPGAAGSRRRSSNTPRMGSSTSMPDTIRIDEITTNTGRQRQRQAFHQASEYFLRSLEEADLLIVDSFS